MTEPKEYPGYMDRPLRREDGQNGSLIIQFVDAAHLADTWNFARKHDLEQEFEKRLLQLISVALGGAVPYTRTEMNDQVFEGRPGQDSKITIFPDGRKEPSFFWEEEKGMHGGLIFHRYGGTWGIHT